MDINKAIETLRREYEKAREASFVRDPVAYALYKTWKAADREKPKTDFSGKCGSCAYAVPTVAFGGSKCYIECRHPLAGAKSRSNIAHIKQRSAKACKKYEAMEGK